MDHGEQLAKLAMQVEFLVEKVTKIDYTLHGNGTPGLKTQVDRLEQVYARVQKYLVAVVGAVATALAKAFWPS